MSFHLSPFRATAVDNFLPDLGKIRSSFSPRDSRSIRLSREYYLLQFKAFKSILKYLTCIKVLKEKIDTTKMILDTDNHTILLSFDITALKILVSRINLGCYTLNYSRKGMHNDPRAQPSI